MTKSDSLFDLVRFAARHQKPNHLIRWHSFASDKLTVQNICAGVNLGILQINEHEQFAVKSLSKAYQYLNGELTS